MHHHVVNFFFLILLFNLPSIKSEIQTFKISSDSRPFILLSDFGFNNPGYIDVAVSSASIATTQTPINPTKLSFIGCFYGPTPARRSMELAVMKDACIIGSPFIFPIFTFNELSPFPNPNFNSTILVTIPDLYYVFLVNCARNSSISITLNLKTYNFNPNGDPDYIDDHFTNLPTILFTFSFIYLFFLLNWAYVCNKNKLFLHRIHILMAVLLVFKFSELFCYANSQRSIRQTGAPQNWNILWLIFFFARNMLFTAVIMLIRAGWSIFRPCLMKVQKCVILVAVLLQVIASACFVLNQVVGPSDRNYKYWTVTYYALDFLSCAVIMLPVCKCVDVDDLSVNSKTEGKEARRLVHQRVYENFSFAMYAYLGFTRLGMFFLRTVTSYNFWCLSIALELTVELIFYIVVYLTFRPSERYEYVVLDDREDDHTIGISV